MIERTSPTEAKAEIQVKMGAMSMTFTGTVEVVERDDAAHRAVLRVKSREIGGQGLRERRRHVRPLRRRRRRSTPAAQISGKAASMGEGVVVSVLDGLIKDFTRRSSPAI